MFPRRADNQASFDLIEFVEERFLVAKVELSNKDALFERFAQTFADALGVAPKDVVAALEALERMRTLPAALAHPRLHRRAPLPVNPVITE